MVQVSGGALTRTSSVASIIKIKSNLSRKLRVDTIFEQGTVPCSFLFDQASVCLSRAACPAFFETCLSTLAGHMTASSNPIERSFEIAAGRCEDLTPLVYRRLFQAHSEARAMFRTEGSELVKDSMLALTIEAILDFAGPRTGHFRLIECEISSHDAYGTPRELFGKFFGVIADTMREVLGHDWTPEIDTAWRKLLDEIDSLVAESQPQNEA